MKRLIALAGPILFGTISLGAMLFGTIWAEPALAQPLHSQMGHSQPQDTAGAPFPGGGHDRAPFYYFFRANQLDYGPSQGGGRGSWDIDARIGTDQHRLVLKSEGTYVRGKGDEAEIQLLYATPLTEFLDVQVGARQSYLPVGRSYLAAGVQGLLPWFIDTEATFFLSTLGQPSARLKAEIDLPWTGWIISRPSIEVNAYGSDDRRAGTYAGIGSVKLALQTRYQMTAQIAPYVEIGWEKSVGQTGAAARQEGERIENAYSVVGLRLLY